MSQLFCNFILYIGFALAADAPQPGYSCNEYFLLKKVDAYLNSNTLDNTQELFEGTDSSLFHTVDKNLSDAIWGVRGYLLLEYEETKVVSKVVILKIILDSRFTPAIIRALTRRVRRRYAFRYSTYSCSDAVLSSIYPKKVGA